jgi:hypothetical protein
MPIFSSSSGYSELIFILVIILFQLIGVIFQKLREKKNPAKAVPRREFKSTPQQPPVSQSPQQDKTDIESELEELFEALGMDLPRKAQNPLPTQSSPRPPQPALPRKPDVPPASEAKVLPDKPMPAASLPVPVFNNREEGLGKAMEFNVAPLSERSSDAITGTIKVNRPRYADLKSLLKDHDEARRGILIAEILGKPVGLR